MRPLLALFIRAMREDTRSRATFIVRTLVILLILGWLWITHQRARWSGAPGREFFLSVLWIDLVVICLAGLNYFASAISEEKEDGTLGLLRMTDLNALAILLGKSTGRLLGALMLLIVQIPFALVAVTMGGLNVAQILGGYLCLLSFTFLVANAGLLASVLCRRTNAATSIAMLLLGAFLFGPWLAQNISNGLGQFHLPTLPLAAQDFLDSWRDALPGTRLNRVLRTGFTGSLWSAQAAVSLVLGVVCFLAAWLVFEPMAKRASDPDATMAPRRSRLRRSSRVQGECAAAVRWKQFKLLGGMRALVIKTLAVLLCVGAFTTTMRLGGENWEGFKYICLFTGAGFFLLYCTGDAANIFGAERQQQTLASLMLLPIPARRIAWEKVRGCFAMNWPAFACAAFGVVLFSPDIAKEVSQELTRRPSQSLIALCGWSHGVFGYALLPVFVAWLSLRMRRGAAALGITIWLVGGYMGSALVLVMMREAGVMVLPFLSGTLLVFLVCNIPRRLEALAAEE